MYDWDLGYLSPPMSLVVYAILGTLALLFAVDAEVDTEDSLCPAACMFAVLFVLKRVPCCSLL